MKRIGCLILVIILCTVITSCKANNNAAINYKTLYKSQPIVYQSGSDLYIVKEDNKPQKIVSGKFEPVNNKNITNFMFDVNGIFRAKCQIVLRKFNIWLLKTALTCYNLAYGG